MMDTTPSSYTMPDPASMVHPSELAAAARLLTAMLAQPADPLSRCFSFSYSGVPSADLLPQWAFVFEQATQVNDSEQFRLSWTEPLTRLVVRLEITRHTDFPVLEWVVTFHNDGEAPTPLLSDVLAIDLTLPATFSELHHALGDTCGWDGFLPQRVQLERGCAYTFAPSGGRPTSLAFPYFNLRLDGYGVMIALGWPGQWQADFSREAENNTVHVRGGQQTLCCSLQPGEEIRTSLAVLCCWQGDSDWEMPAGDVRASVIRRTEPDLLRAQNLWRRWMLAKNLPRVVGALHPPFTSQCTSCWVNAVDELQAIDALVAHDARLDYWWMDAGWWPEGFPVCGHWETDVTRFPRGIEEVSAHAHANGMGYVLWFEPERVSPGTPWAALDDWLLALPPAACRERIGEAFNEPKFTRDEAERNQILAGDRLYNLGHAGARRSLVEFLAARINAWDIDILRIDHNISPLAFWQAADAPERQGLTENHYVSGWLALLDELRARFPRLWIDTCASGGRRIDLETLRRALPLLRSDYQFEPNGNQNHTLGLAPWVPFFGTGVHFEDPYICRSSFAPAFGLGSHSAPDTTDWDVFRRRLAEWQRLARYFLGDFYPLTAASLDTAVWAAWQYHRPDLGAGAIQAFRRAESPYTTAALPLYGLDATSRYRFTDPESGADMDITGEELLTRGLPLYLQGAPQAKIWLYETITA